MKTYKTYNEFKTVDRQLRQQGKELSEVFLSHVKDALNFFHTTGSYNIQIVNDVLDTSSAMRLQRNRIVDWVAQLVGHEIIKLDGGKFGFGKKIVDTDYEEVAQAAGAFFEEYPDWYAYKAEHEPEGFEVEKASLKVKKYLESMAKKAKEGGYSAMSETLEAMRLTFETSPVMQADEVEVEGVVIEALQAPDAEVVAA